MFLAGSKMSISKLLLGFLAIFFKASNVESGKTRPKDNMKPNIIFIVIDDMGTKDLGYKGSGINTPEIDALAASGIKLNNYYVHPTCSPTRAAFLTGRYGSSVGIHIGIPCGSNVGLPLDEELLPQMLRRAGYQAHGVGKWHLGVGDWAFTPTFRGFQSYYGGYTGSKDHFGHFNPVREGAGDFSCRDEGTYDLRFDDGDDCGKECSKVVDEQGNYSTHIFTKRAIDIIDQHDKDVGPLFIYQAYVAPHWPVQVPDSYLEDYKDMDDFRAKYAGMLTAIDEGVGQIKQALKDNDMWEDTLIIVTSDNGGPLVDCEPNGSSNDPYRAGKCSIYEGGVKSDGVIAGPAMDKLGFLTKHESKHLMHAVDWFPTLAALVGVEPQGKKLDGVKQLKTFSRNVPSRKEVFLGWAGFMVIEESGAARMGWSGPGIRRKQWKLIQVSGGVEEGNLQPPNTVTPQPGGIDDTTYLLFDVENDPEELEDVAETNPDIVKQLKKKLRKYQEDFTENLLDDKDCPYAGNVDGPYGPDGTTLEPWGCSCQGCDGDEMKK